MLGNPWRVNISAVGPFLRSRAPIKAPAVSSGSAGRITSRPGITLSPLTVSTGWCVGPSSPTPTESWVKMYMVGR